MDTDASKSYHDQSESREEMQIQAPSGDGGETGTTTSEIEVTEDDSDLNVALQEIVKKTEKPMNQFHNRVYKYMVDIDQQLDQLASENVKLKEEREIISKSLLELGQKTVSLERDRDAWKIKAEQLKKGLDKSKTDPTDKQCSFISLKRERDKLKSDMAEVSKTMANRDIKAKELEMKLNKLRKTNEEQTLELQRCEISKRQMAERIAILERCIREEEAVKEELQGKFNTLQMEKRNQDVKLETQIVETSRIMAEQDTLQQEIAMLKNRLMNEREKESKNNNDMGEEVSSSGTLNSPLQHAVKDEYVDEVARKRKAGDVVVESFIDSTGSKKTKVVTTEEKDEETEEEGEIIEHHPEEEETSIVTYASSASTGKYLQRSDNVTIREGKSAHIHNSMKNNYRSYSRHDYIIGKFGRGKR